MSPALAARLGPEVFLTETRAFFAPRAATWEARFPDDDPAYAAAVAEVGLHPGQTALDAGCGTGRALPHVRAAVGPTGHVLGLDLTPEMLGHRPRPRRICAARPGRCPPSAAARRQGRRRLRRRPGAPPPRPRARPGRAGPGGPPRRPAGAVPPSGRAALAARHGRVLRDDDLLAPGPLRRLLDRTGWWLDRYDDGPNRFLAIAERTSP
jgi:hypothetical protein